MNFRLKLRESRKSIAYKDIYIYINSVSNLSVEITNKFRLKKVCVRIFFRKGHVQTSPSDFRFMTQIVPKGIISSIDNL